MRPGERLRNEIKLRSFLDLKENWDSYGAKKLNKKCIDQALKINEALAKGVDVFPVCNGGVNIEVNTERIYISIKIRPNEETRIYVKER